MKVDVKEIQRIIDDYETKANEVDELSRMTNVFHERDHHYYVGKASGLIYAATKLRRLIDK